MRCSHPAHDHAALVLRLLMVIRFVAHSDFLFLNLSPKFAVYLEAGAGSRQGVILEDPAHVVEQAGGRQHDGGRMEGVLPFEEEQGSGMET